MEWSRYVRALFKKYIFFINLVFNQASQLIIKNKFLFTMTAYQKASCGDRGPGLKIKKIKIYKYRTTRVTTRDNTTPHKERPKTT
jgi:hypothetical protein